MMRVGTLIHLRDRLKNEPGFRERLRERNNRWREKNED